MNDKGELFRKVSDRFVKIPKISEREGVLKENHDGHGHFGQDATWARLYRYYWWPNSYNEVKEYVKSCKACQMHSYLPNRTPLVGTVPVERLFERFAVDFIGPFPESEKKNKYILMAVEYYTNWPVAKAVRRADSATVINFLYEEIFCAYGPYKILTDNGSHFSNEEVEKFAKYVNTKHQFAAPYHPQTNGKVEQLNITIVRGIRKMIDNNPKNWDVLLPSMLYAYRTKVHKRLNISPYEALFGTAPRLPSMDPLQELGLKLGAERLYLLLDKHLSYEDKIKGRSVEEDKTTGGIPIGSQVIKTKYSKKHKLDTTYMNKLFTVIGKFNKNTYILLNEQGVKLKRAVNGAHLKIFNKRKDQVSKISKA